ncbi:ankyrin repeat-containing domain protein [Apiospora aurea]|uniref:Ankyrin repeat-containing domain protein n=1 Tax=Apiospora aurea TaxID=335848 RepID=A0ABR1QUM3_9PEZI
MSSQKERDTALRIACSNTLPRIAAHHLAKGDPNSVSPFGLGALRVALMRRPLSSIVHGSQRFIAESDVYSILRLLLDYGAAVALPTQTTRAHIGGPQCWKPMQCDHSGQPGLHLVAASGFPMCARLLPDNGANHRHKNAGGYTALYRALCPANREVADILLACSSEANPVVKFPQGVTTLHIACRFAYTDMVNAILLRGADVNVVDSYGNTHLHEALCQMGPGRTADVVETLRLLAQHGANPDINPRVPAPRQKAETHPFPAVREMFVLDKPKPSRIRPLTASTEIRDPLRSKSSKNDRGGPKLVDRQTPTMWAEPKTEHVI